MRDLLSGSSPLRGRAGLDLRVAPFVGRITDHVGVSGPSLAPVLNALVDAGFVERCEDPIRDNRPLYYPADPIIRFHYAVTRPNHTRFSHANGRTLAVWRAVRATFLSRVVGPNFESMVRQWVAVYASSGTVGGDPAHVGQTSVNVEGTDRQVDVVVADDVVEPARRNVLAVGEAKYGQTITRAHLRALERVKASLGDRATGAKLLLFGPGFEVGLRRSATNRNDVELVDFDRLYNGR